MAEIMEETEMELDEDTQKGKFLTFTIENEDYGLEIRYVTEIIGIQQITAVPELPEYIKGIINLRGKIIPVIDVRLRFKKEFRQYDNRTCIVVIDIQDMEVGIIVDAVSEVMTIQDEEIVPPPDFNRGLCDRFISGIGKVGEEVKLLLDCSKLLNDTEIRGLEEIY